MLPLDECSPSMGSSRNPNDLRKLQGYMLVMNCNVKRCTPPANGETCLIVSLKIMGMKKKGEKIDFVLSCQFHPVPLLK
ncbi:hypothetical protein Tco_1464099 [Tanacetum coccineum]